MARKKKHAEHENLERWLVSYADLMTLLFALFTTMYAISTVDAKKMGRLVLSMKAAFDPINFATSNTTGMNLLGEQPTEPPKNSIFNGAVARAAVASSRKRAGKGGRGSGAGPGLYQIKSDLAKLALHAGLSDKVHILIRRNGVVVSLAEAGFFESGQHEIKGASLALVDSIGAYISRLPNPVRIEGHTDDQQIRTARFPSNWELSTQRATYLVSRFIKVHEIDPARLSAAGYAEYHPVSPNDTAAGRARNRRVDLVIEVTPPPDLTTE
jgi:chemotaxis protein MotB